MSARSHFSRYSPGYVRGVLYALVAFLTSFIAVFEDVPPAQFATLTLIGWAILWAKVFLPTAVTMRAFFDGTMERIAQQASPQAATLPANPQVPTS